MGTYQRDIKAKADYILQNPQFRYIIVDKGSGYVKHDTKSVIIFILCYNDETETSALKEYAKYSWARVVRIPTTKYLENIMYHEWLRKNQLLWENHDYVGTLSWKTTRKIKMPDIEKAKFFCKSRDIDVIVFHMIVNKVLLTDTDRCHPMFSKIWNKWLNKLGFLEEDINNPAVYCFYCNYWMASPEWMKKYLDFFENARDVLENDPELQEEVHSNSNFMGGALSSDKLLAFRGRPYYTYHVFLYERLPCFFFWKYKARLYALRDGELIV